MAKTKTVALDGIQFDLEVDHESYDSVITITVSRIVAEGKDTRSRTEIIYLPPNHE